MDDERNIMRSLTGEYFQPVRLHYQVFDHEQLLKELSELRCVKRDPTQDRWCWLYEDEARNLLFMRSYAQFSEQLRPIVLGSIFVRREDELLIDLRTCERATAAVLFFDKYISRDVARITRADVVNRLFSNEGNTKLMPHDLFDREPITIADPDALVQKIIELTTPIEDSEERVRVALADMEARAKNPLPGIENFPVRFYEEGIEGFEQTLRLRQILALRHWLGETE